eukprot:UN07861
MIIIADRQRAAIALENNLFVFLGTMLLFVATLIYSQVQLSKANYVMHKNDALILAVSRILGAIVAVVIFRIFFFHILSVDDVREIFTS